VKAFEFVRPRTAEAAAAALAAGGSVALKANGVDLLDRMKERVDEPDRVVGLVDAAGLAGIRGAKGSGFSIGAMTTLQDLADHEGVRASLPALAKAAGLAASPQLRRRATVGGNLAQHTRCGYYRHVSFPCWKRGADACPVRAEGGVQETAGIFQNDPCASAHPSSLAPALGALDAAIVVRGKAGERRLPFADLWAKTAKGRAADTVLGPDEVIVSVEVPASAEGLRQGYEEVRQKAAFDWALVSCAVRFTGGESAVKEARVWLGSVAPTPLRAAAAEGVLVGKRFDEALARKAGDAAAEGATPLPGNAYKVALVKVAVRRALLDAWGRT
jgi:xanthine dehydrogenase YagS FAD-binding subunit